VSRQVGCAPLCVTTLSAPGIYKGVFENLRLSNSALSETSGYVFLIRFQENQTTSAEAMCPLPGGTSIQYRQIHKIQSVMSDGRF
jgi:hypothetical protein